MIIKLSKSTTDQTNIAAAYLRVSTIKQIKDGNSIESQKEFAKELAYTNGLDLDDNHIFVESRPASTVNNDKFNEDSSIYNRPVLNKVLTLAAQGKFGKLIVYSRDRLTRNVEEYFSLKHMLRKCNVEICYVKASDNIIPSNLDDEKKQNNIESLIEIILTSVAELEANMIASRVKLGNQQCAREGLWPGGKIPFGYMSESVKLRKRKRTNSALHQIPYEKEIINEIFHLYTNHGMGYRKLAEEMNKKYPFKNWTKSSIETILKNEIYTGHIVWGRRGGRRNPGKNEEYEVSNYIPEMEIINRDLWENSLKVRSKKEDLSDPKYYQTPFLLKNKLLYGICGKEMTCKNYGTNAKSAYRCPTRGDKNKSELILEKTTLQNRFIASLQNAIHIENLDDMWLKYISAKSKKEEEFKATLTDYNTKVNAINLQLTEVKNVLNQNIDQSIKLELNQLINFLKKKLDSYSEIIQHKEDVLKSFYQSKEDFQSSLDQFFVSFKELDVSNQRMLIDFIVEKVIVTPATNSINLQIILNPPKFV